MTETVTLRFRGKDVDFTKSERLGAVRARAGMETAMRDDIERRAPGYKGLKIRMIGTFEIIELEGFENDVDQVLDWLRSRPAVAVATHVFHSNAADVLYVPTGNIHVVFKDYLSGHEQQALLNNYRLQAVETRGDGDFLVTITAGSKNPVATSAALQREAMIDLAEPDFAEVQSVF